MKDFVFLCTKVGTLCHIFHNSGKHSKFPSLHMWFRIFNQVFSRKLVSRVGWLQFRTAYNYWLLLIEEALGGTVLVLCLYLANLISIGWSNYLMLRLLLGSVGSKTFQSIIWLSFDKSTSNFTSGYLILRRTLGLFLGWIRSRLKLFNWLFLKALFLIVNCQ